MVFGHARIPIMTWMREQAAEALVHATQAGEEVTAMGARISLDIGEFSRGLITNQSTISCRSCFFTSAKESSSTVGFLN